MHRQAQFEHLRASELYCPTCRKLQPVRERLLLILPQAELYDYRCITCGLSLGSREVKAPVQTLVSAASLPRSPARSVMHSVTGGPRHRPGHDMRGA